MGLDVLGCTGEGEGHGVWPFSDSSNGAVRQGLTDGSHGEMVPHYPDIPSFSEGDRGAANRLIHDDRVVYRWDTSSKL